MFLSDLSIRRPIMISMVLIVFLLFGALAFFRMSLDLTPDVDIPYITVQTVYPGSGPREVETQVTKKLEDAISSVSRIKTMTSYSMEGVSFIVLEFELGKDVDIANQEVKDKIDAILNDLPDDADLPLVQKFSINEIAIVDVVLTGDLPLTELRDIADRKLRDRFTQLEGVARTKVTGGEEREIEVVLDNRTVFQNAISLPQLAQVLGAQNLTLPGGHFKTLTQEYAVRVNGEFDSVATLGALEIPTAFGDKPLGDLADIRDTGAEVRERTSYFNNIDQIGKPDVVLLSLSKTAAGNVVDIAQAVQDALPAIAQDLPPGCTLEMVSDRSVFIRSTVEDTLMNIILGIVLTGLVLLVFLHDVRSTIIVAVAMPMSILSAFMLMNMSGFSLNLFSLMGLSTAVGILVTNSVVVLENIFRHKEMGHDRKTAASLGTAEIMIAVVASTLTNIAVFLPIANMSSMIGLFFREFALTVTYATLFSLLISFTLTPMMASLVLPEQGSKKRRIGDRLERWFRRLEEAYERLLGVVLHSKRRATSVLIAALILFVASLPLGVRVGFEFIPMMDEGDIRIEVELPLGYNLGETADLLQTIESRLRQHRSVKHFLTTLGTISEINTGPNVAVMMIKLVDAAQRDQKTTDIASAFIEELADVPNARIRVAAVSSMGGGDHAQVSFTLLGQDVDRLEEYKDQMLERLRGIEGLVNLNTSSRSGTPEINITPDRLKLADAGLTVYDLALTVRGALTGLVATQYKEAGEEYDLRVMLDDASTVSPEDVGNITVAGPSGRYRLSQLANIAFAEGFSNIMHQDKYKAIQISGAPAPGVPLGDLVTAVNDRIAEIDLPPGYRIDWGGDVEMMQETTTDMIGTFILALVLTYMLLAAILESLTQPLLILGTVPLAFIGVFSGLLITGKTMNVISMMAIVMLLGIVVNNAILLLDYTNVLVRQKAREPRAALLQACPTKLKPILMSTIAIILGMLPMALGFGAAGREIRQPMGIVSIGGLVVSTVLTLVVIPGLYYLTTKSKHDATAVTTSK